MSKKWVVVHCWRDDSHVLVSDDAVVYDDHLRVDDEVNFAYHKNKFERGTVKAISDDHAAMMKVQDKLNRDTRPKRNPSFDATKPRHAAVVCKSKGFGGVLSKNKPPPPRKPKKGKAKSGGNSSTARKASGKPKNPALSALVAEVTSDSDSDDSQTHEDGKSSLKKETLFDKEDSDSDSDVVLTEEETVALLQAAKKRKKEEMQMLRDISSKNKKPRKDSSSGFLDSELAGISGSGNGAEVNVSQSEQADGSKDNDLDDGLFKNTDVQQDFEQAENPKNIDEQIESGSGNKPSSSGSGSGQSSPSSPVDPKPSTTPLHNKFTSKLKKHASQNKKDVLKIQYEGPMLVHDPKNVKPEGKFYIIEDEQDKEEDMRNKTKLEKLMQDHQIYVNAKDLKKAKDRCATPSSLTRSITRLVFTAAAREMCSVSGRCSLEKGQQKPVMRTCLDQIGVEAIIEFVQNRAGKKSWKVPDSSAIKQYMGNLLCEERTAARLAAASEPEGQSGESGKEKDSARDSEKGRED